MPAGCSAIRVTGGFNPFRSRAAGEASWILAGNLARTAVQFLVLLFVARVEGPAQAGQLAFALAVTAPLFVLAQMGLREVYLTASWSVSLQQVQGVRGVSVLCAFVISWVIAALQDVAPMWVVLTVALVKAVDTLAEGFSGPLQERGGARLVGQALVLNAAGTAVCSGAILFAGGGLVLALAASALVSLAVSWRVLGIGLRRLQPRDRPHVAGGSVRRVLRAGASLGVSSSLNSLLFGLPVFLLAAIAGDAAVGSFAPLAYVLTGASLVIGAGTQVLLPRFSRATREGASATRTLMYRALSSGLGVASLMAALVALLGRPVMGWLFGREVFEGLAPGSFVALGVALLAIPVTQICTARSLSLNSYGQLVPASALALMMTLLLGLVLVPRLEQLGAVLLLAFAAYLRAALSAWGLVRELRRATQPGAERRQGHAMSQGTRA